MKEQLEKEFDNQGCNGSGSVLSRLLSLDISFAEMDYHKTIRVEYTDDGEDKDNYDE